MEESLRRNGRDGTGSSRTNADIDNDQVLYGCDDDDDGRNVDDVVGGTSAPAAAAGQLLPPSYESNCARLLRSAREPERRNWCG